MPIIEDVDDVLFVVLWVNTTGYDLELVLDLEEAAFLQLLNTFQKRRSHLGIPAHWVVFGRPIANTEFILSLGIDGANSIHITLGNQNYISRGGWVRYRVINVEKLKKELREMLIDFIHHHPPTKEDAHRASFWT